jgi:hypothetical protein
VGRADPIDRPNTPLKAIPMFQKAKLPNALASPTSTGRARAQPLTEATNQVWTQSRLEKERNDWWDTQVTGSPEVWGAIRLAAQSLQAGKLRDAQQWLETMECTCPTGCLWKGVYDSTGIMYRVPEWLIVEPEGLVPEQTGDDAEGGPATGTDATQEPEDDEDDEPVGVRVRVSRDGRDVVIKLRSRLPVASIVEKIKEQAEVRSCPYQLLVAAAHNTDMVMTQPTCHKSKPVMSLHCNDSKNEGQADKRQLDSSSRIRLVYGGRVYQDNEVLESHPFWDFANDYVINALVLE